MRLKTKRIVVCMVLFYLPALVWGASPKDTRKPLRYPFGLQPSTTVQFAAEILKVKGLTYLSEHDVAGTHFVYWKLNDLIVYDHFVPTLAIATFDHQKLSSFSLHQEGIKGCGAAQPVFVSALDFLNDNYQTEKKAQYTQEPATETLDCGPHFNSSSYELQLTNKDFVGSVIPTLKDGQYTIAVTYRWAGLLKTDDKKDGDEDQKLHTLQENL